MVVYLHVLVTAKLRMGGDIYYYFIGIAFFYYMLFKLYHIISYCSLSRAMTSIQSRN